MRSFPFRSIRPFFASLLAAAAVAACSDSTAPPTPRPQNELRIVTLAPDAPPLLANSVTFNACKGTNAEGRLFFAGIGGTEGEEFARLKLDNETLLARPDGTPIADGECVAVTMGLADPLSKQLLLQLEPSGLKFDPAHPAELRLDYGEADLDLNDDGNVNASDAQIEQQLSIWRQETPGDPFVQLPTTRSVSGRTGTSLITGFTRYAYAF
ncbi:MAG TPA: hypothetical protein VFW66_10715 [Gemmatimonadales bacterium]|nr:hypothetical protein [Gemmatimonadales bacterium]